MSAVMEMTIERVHIRFDGMGRSLSRDLTVTDLQLGRTPSDAEVRQAVATYVADEFDVDVAQVREALAEHTVERGEQPDVLLITPGAIYG